MRASVRVNPNPNLALALTLSRRYRSVLMSDTKDAVLQAWLGVGVG